MDWGQLLQTFGFPTAALMATLYAFISERVVSGAAYTRALSERDGALELLREQGQRNERDLAELRATMAARRG